MPINLEDAPMLPSPCRPMGLAPLGAAWVTLGEPPSPPRAVLGSSPRAPDGTLPGVGFDARPESRPLTLGVKGAYKVGTELPTAPHPAKPPETECL